MLSFLVTSALLSQVATSSQPIPIPAGTPIVHAGTWTPAAGFTPSSRGSGSTRGGVDVIYSCDGSYYWPTTGDMNGPWQEWLVIDDFKLKDRNASKTDQIQELTFTYCTDSVSINGEGYGEIQFFDQYTPGSPPPPPIGTIGFSGLPLSSNGNLECYSVTLDLSGPFEVPADINVEFLTEDFGGLNNIAAIAFRYDFAAFASHGSMGPMIGGTNGYGNQDFIEIVDILGNYLGSTNFGGAPFASLACTLKGPAKGSRSYFHIKTNGYAQTPDFYLRNREPVVAGSWATWRAFDLPAGTQMWLAAGPHPDDRPFAGHQGQVMNALIKGRLHWVTMGNGDAVSRPIPLALAGHNIYVQAASTYGTTPHSSNIAFISNAIRQEL